MGFFTEKSNKELEAELALEKAKASRRVRRQRLIKAIEEEKKRGRPKLKKPKFFDDWDDPEEDNRGPLSARGPRF